MLKAVMFWTLSLIVLAGGALVVCPDGQCVLTGFDRSGLDLAHAVRTGWLDWLMPGVTWLGSLQLLLPLTGWGSWFLFRIGRRREAGFILLSLLSASALSHLAKFWVARPRPDLFPAVLPIPADWSYPSAHAMQATAAALALFLVARRRRAAWAVPLATGVLLVGVSRIYLQVHFPSDVIAGTLASAAWVSGLHDLIVRRPEFERKTG